MNSGIKYRGRLGLQPLQAEWVSQGNNIPLDVDVSFHTFCLACKKLGSCHVVMLSQFENVPHNRVACPLCTNQYDMHAS